MASDNKVVSDVKLQKIVDKLRAIKDRQQLNEEQTKNGFILPLFAALGYDVFDTDEFVPEYTADFGTKNGEKVDYAICINGQPLMLVEAKKLGVNLCREYVSQLFRYYATTEARLAVLTNGDDYWFFTDIVKKNQMDTEPYMKIKVSQDADIDIRLYNYRRENISHYDVAEDARYKKYENVVDEFMNNLASGNLDATFIEYLAGQADCLEVPKSRLAATFSWAFQNRFKEVEQVEKTDTAPKYQRDSSRMSKIDLDIGYVFNQVDWAFHKPRCIVLDGQKIDTTSFKEVLIEALKYICNKFTDAPERLTAKLTGTFKIVYSKDKDLITRGLAQIPGTDLYTCTSLSGNEIKRFIDKVFTEFGVDSTKLVVYFES